MLLRLLSRSGRAASTMATAIGLLTVAGMAHSAPPSAQEIRDRLSGNTQNPATSPAQKPDPAADLCSTQEAIEANPAGCSQALSGPDRAMSLLGPIGAGHPATTAAGHPATGAQRMSLAGAGSQPKKKPVHAAAVTSGAAGCSVLDAGDSSAANLCVTFALNSAILNGQSRTSLDHLAQVLVADFPHRGVKIEGFADASGDRSEERRVGKEC